MSALEATCTSAQSRSPTSTMTPRIKPEATCTSAQSRSKEFEKAAKVVERSNLHKCAEQKPAGYCADQGDFLKQLAQMRRAEGAELHLGLAVHAPKQLAQVRRAETT